MDLEDVIQVANVKLVFDLGDHGDPESLEFVVRTNDAIDLVEGSRSSDTVSER